MIIKTHLLYILKSLTSSAFLLLFFLSFKMCLYFFCMILYFCLHLVIYYNQWLYLISSLCYWYSSFHFLDVVVTTIISFLPYFYLLSFWGIFFDNRLVLFSFSYDFITIKQDSFFFCLLFYYSFTISFLSIVYFFTVSLTLSIHILIFISLFLFFLFPIISVSRLHPVKITFILRYFNFYFFICISIFQFSFNSVAFISLYFLSSQYYFYYFSSLIRYLSPFQFLSYSIFDHSITFAFCFFIIIIYSFLLYLVTFLFFFVLSFPTYSSSYLHHVFFVVLSYFPSIYL